MIKLRKSTSLEIDITTYEDHLHFLKDIMRMKKEVNPAFSIEFFSRQLNLKNKSILAMCLTGARFPNQQLIDNISDYLKLNPMQRKYFKRLVIVKKLEKEGADLEIIRSILQRPLSERSIQIPNQRLEELRKRIDQFESEIRAEFHDLSGELQIELSLESRQLSN